MAILVIKRPGQQEERVTLSSEEESLIGRLPDCTIYLDDPAVSRRQAILSPGTENHDYSIRDLGSRNGTWVNSKAVEDEAVTLNSGDRIQLGRTGIHLQYLADDATITQERSPTLNFSLAALGLDVGWLGSRWGRLPRVAPWLRLAATLLGLVAASLGIAFWILRLVTG